MTGFFFLTLMRSCFIQFNYFTAKAVNIRQMLVGLNIIDYIYRFSSRK